MSAPPEVRLERMLPHQVEDAVAGRSVAYVPLGSVEHHSLHLPLGLDGLTAHGVCTRSAARTGGVVLPVLWWGTGGTHTAYPWTVMVPDAAPLQAILAATLARLADLGVEVCVLFSGHFADEQLALVDAAAAAQDAAGRPPLVLPLAVNRSDADVEPDHAGVFETLLLHALHPDLVQPERLPSLAQLPLDGPDAHGGYEHRHEAGHPLPGIMGPDPRGLDLTTSAALLEQVVGWTCRRVDTALAVAAQRRAGSDA